ERHAGPFVVGGGDREGEIGRCSVRRDVLHDHVHVDVTLGEWAKDGGGYAGFILHPANRNLSFVLGEGDAGNDLLFHDVSFVANERAGWRPGRVDVLRFFKAGTHEDTHVVHHAKFDRSHLHDLAADRCKLKHFRVRDLIKAVGLGHHAWVGGIDAIHVGVDVAAFCADCGGDRDRRSVGSATAERRHATGVFVHTLETSDDRDLAVLLKS